MIKTEVRPLAGFEDDYVRYINRKNTVVEELQAEYDAELDALKSKYECEISRRTETLDKLISLTCETIEVEYPDPEPECVECENQEVAVEEVSGPVIVTEEV